jgi:hypothetical protein
VRRQIVIGQGWVKSSLCSAEGCVEVEHRGKGVAVRNSRNPGGGELVFTPAEWSAFLGGVELGEFDQPGQR